MRWEAVEAWRPHEIWGMAGDRSLPPYALHQYGSFSSDAGERWNTPSWPPDNERRDSGPACRIAGPHPRPSSLPRSRVGVVGIVSDIHQCHVKDYAGRCPRCRPATRPDRLRSRPSGPPQIHATCALAPASCDTGHQARCQMITVRGLIPCSRTVKSIRNMQKSNMQGYQ